MATQKERNTKVAKLIAGSAFWNGAVFTRHFTDDFTMDIPSAPPGMPNHYSTWEAERCFEWLNRSVRKWISEILEFYPTPDADVFWVHGKQSGDVFWGDQDGSLETHFFMRIEFRNGKIAYLNWRFHTWAWLLAAGKRYHSHVLSLPADEKGNVDEYNKGFLIDLEDPDIQAYLDRPSFGEIPVGQSASEFSDAQEEIYKRRQVNIYQFAAGVERDVYRSRESLNEKYKKFAYFVGDPYPLEDGINDAEMSPGMFAWNKVCSPWMYRDPRSKFYPTDDPNVIFVEMNAHGPGCWRANSVTIGHYKQDYLVRLILDDLGRLVRFEEVASPINGLNSTGSEIDNFPYYH